MKFGDNQQEPHNNLATISNDVILNLAAISNNVIINCPIRTVFTNISHTSLSLSSISVSILLGLLAYPSKEKYCKIK